MRIGIDCRTILNPGYLEDAGVGHYTYYLVKHLLAVDQENEYVLFFGSEIAREVILEIIGGRPNTEYRVFPFHVFKHFLPAGLALALFRGFISEARFDLFHSPGSELPNLAPARSVLTVHDLGPLIYPGWYRGKEKAEALRKSVANASEFILPTAAAKDDFLKIFSKIAAIRAHVIHHGVDGSPHSIPTEDIRSPADVVNLEDLKEKYKISEKYCLYLGSLEPRKNIKGLVRAWEKAALEFPDVQLALAGAKKDKAGEVLREINKVNKKLGRETIKYIGYVLGIEKWALMRFTKCFIFPSFYESFGLPALEAMSQGAPVAVANIPALVEIASGAAEFFNPKSSIEMYRAIAKILSDDQYRANLKQKSLARAKLFSWTRTAEETVALYGAITGALKH